MNKEKDDYFNSKRLKDAINSKTVIAPTGMNREERRKFIESVNSEEFNDNIFYNTFRKNKNIHYIFMFIILIGIITYTFPFLKMIWLTGLNAVIYGLLILAGNVWKFEK